MRDWNVLIDTLDFESDEWYERRESSWHPIGLFGVNRVLKELGFKAAEYSDIQKRFIQRDRSARKRGHKAKKKIKSKAEKIAQTKIVLETQQELDL